MALDLKHRLLPRLNSGRPTPLSPTTAPRNAIPRIIHRTAPARPLPPVLADNLAATRALNPDWEQRLYDDGDVAEFIQRRFGSGILRAFRRIDPRYGPARADLFRYLVMYDTGGVYLDVKSAARKPLTEVIRASDRFLIAQWPGAPESRFRTWGLHPELAHVPGGEFLQWFMAAAPGHPFLQAVIERVLANIGRYVPSLHGVGRPGVIRVTGPVAYTLAIAPLLSLHPHRMVEAEEELGLRYSIFEDEDGHKNLVTNHYATLTDSVIVLRPTQAILDLGVRLSRRVRALAPGHHGASEGG